MVTLEKWGLMAGLTRRVALWIPLIRRLVKKDDLFGAFFFARPYADRERWCFLEDKPMDTRDIDVAVAFGRHEGGSEIHRRGVKVGLLPPLGIGILARDMFPLNDEAAKAFEERASDVPGRLKEAESYTKPDMDINDPDYEEVAQALMEFQEYRESLWDWWSSRGEVLPIGDNDER